MKAIKWILSLFKTEEFKGGYTIPRDRLIVTTTNLSTRYHRQQEFFVANIYKKVKYTWKKNPADYSVYFLDSEFYAAKGTIPNKTNAIYVGNLLDLYNSKH